MSRAPIPDEDLVAQSAIVTIWTTSTPSPKDVWSLADAVAWVMAQEDRDRITLFRPPGEHGSAWLLPDQIARLARRLAIPPGTEAAPRRAAR